MVLAIIRNKFKLEESAAFVTSVWMRAKAAYGKDAEAAHHLASMRKLTKAKMPSNAPSIDSKISTPSQLGTKNADTTI